MRFKFWQSKKLVKDNLNETELKVLSRYLLNQQDVINSLTEQNMKLTAEIQVLREVVDDLRDINSITVSRAFKLREAERRTSPFKR